MAKSEVCRIGVSEAEKDAFVAALDDAARLLGVGKLPKFVFDNHDGTWDVGCTLEGDDGCLETALSYVYLYSDASGAS